MWNFVVEKLKELWLAIENFWGQFLGWFDKVFPPDTRADKLHQWLHIGLIVLIVVVSVAVVFTCLYYCCKCCCRGGGRGGRMMKAPGRGFRMPRSPFEANPKLYFRNLRSNPGAGPDELW